MFEILPESEGNAVSVKATGTLTHEAYAKLTPELERLFAERGKLNILFDITESDGWDVHGAWDDFALGLKHRGDFGRMAVVGHAKWEEIGTKLAGVLMSAEVRYFPPGERDAAWAWTKGGGAA